MHCTIVHVGGFYIILINDQVYNCSRFNYIGFHKVIGVSKLAYELLVYGMCRLTYVPGGKMKIFAYCWLAIASMVLSFPLTASAAALRFSVDGSAFTRCDDGAVCDLAGADTGVTGVSQSLTSSFLFFSTTFAETTPAITGPEVMDINSMVLLSPDGNPHSLVIEFSETDFLFSNAPLIGSFGGTLAENATISFSAFLDTSNTLFGKTTQIGNTATFDQTAFSGSWDPYLLDSTPYSLTQVVALSFDRAVNFSTTSFDFDLTVPEPASIALMVIGFGAFGFSRHMKRC